tara:strand:- start:273 stop:422 length:150 start_codon:yes stop_codon:yes gene_type:complete
MIDTLAYLNATKTLTYIIGYWSVGVLALAAVGLPVVLVVEIYRSRRDVS